MKYLSTLLSLCLFTLIFSQDTATISVTVQNNLKQAIAGEQIIFQGVNNQQIVKGISNENGHFLIQLLGNETYQIKLKAIGKAQEYNTVTIPPLEPNERYGINELTLTITPPKIFTLNNVYFDSGKATLKTSSYTELNELLEYLQLKPNLRIEISGHTDNVGQAENNQTLSENRALAVKNYLVKQGINSNRITTIGYGSTKPIAYNTTAEGRQKNRRTEVKLL